MHRRAIAASAGISSGTGRHSCAAGEACSVDEVGVLRCADEIGAGLVTRACMAVCIVHRATWMAQGTRAMPHANELPCTSTVQLARTQHGTCNTKRPTLKPQLQHATVTVPRAAPNMPLPSPERTTRATDTSRAPAPARPIRPPPHAPIGLHARCLAAVAHSPARAEVARAAGLARDGARAAAATRRSFDWSARARRADRS